MSFLPVSDMATFVNSQRSENTRLAYKQDLDAFVSWVGEDELDEERVIEWRNYLENQLSNASALRRFTTVRSFYRWLGASRQSPFERVKAPRRIQSWSPIVPDEQSIDRVLSICSNTRDSAILTLLNNGLRAQEVCDLNAEDIYFDTAYQRTILRVTGKGMKMRLVPANRQTLRALRLHEMPASGRVFKGMNIRKVYHIVKKWSRNAGVEGLHPHSLRHSYATRLVRNRVNVMSVQRLLGHERTDTTSVYVNLDLRDLIDATTMDPRDGIYESDGPDGTEVWQTDGASPRGE